MLGWAVHRSLTAFSPGSPLSRAQKPSRSEPWSMTCGTGVKATAQRRRATSAERSNPRPASAHLANRRSGPAPISKVNPPRRFCQTGLRRSPTLRRRTAAGTSTSSDGGPASSILAIMADERVATGTLEERPFSERRTATTTRARPSLRDHRKGWRAVMATGRPGLLRLLRCRRGRRHPVPDGNAAERG